MKTVLMILVGLALLAFGSAHMFKVTGVSAAEPVSMVIPRADTIAGGVAWAELVVNSNGHLVSAVQIAITFDDAYILSAAGSRGPALGEDWIVQCHSPLSGELRCLAAEMSGEGSILEGAVFHLDFGIRTQTAPGPIHLRPQEIVVLGPDPELKVEALFHPLQVLMCGDVTGDGVIDVGDVITLIRILVGLVDPTPVQLLVGDVGPNLLGDGALTLKDVVFIIHHIVGSRTIGGCGMFV